MSLNKSETWKWKNWEISWSLSKEYSSEKNIQILLHNLINWVLI